MDATKEKDAADPANKAGVDATKASGDAPKVDVAKASGKATKDDVLDGWKADQLSIIFIDILLKLLKISTRTR